MASVRLSRSHRDIIARKAVAYKFDPILAQLHSEGRALALDVLDSLLSKHEKFLLQQVPSNWLSDTHRFQLMVAGVVMELSWNTASAIAVPRHLAPNWGAVAVFDRDHELTEKLEAWDASHRVYKDTRKIREAQIKGVLEQATTLKRLLEIWPEVKPFLPAALTDPNPRNLPVPQIQQLNMDLGLPVPEGEDNG